MNRLLVVSSNPYYPDCSGGAELSTHRLLLGLRDLGWQVEVLCAYAPRDPLLLAAGVRELERKGSPAHVIEDDDLGYPCWRCLVARGDPAVWIAKLAERARAFAPDVVLNYQDPGCLLLGEMNRQGHPCIYFAHNLAAFEHRAPIPGGVRIIANTPYTASRLREFTGREVPVVHELVDRERYVVDRGAGTYVTFINPIPEKGLSVALAVARAMPEERFLFVKGRWVTTSDRAIDELLLPARELPNVEIRAHQSDMRDVYAATKTLLVPSLFTETFGRVILEAHINGIPVVAADVGGIPYALGGGGILVRPRTSAKRFVAALHRLRQERGLHAALSRAAVANSERREFEVQGQVEEFARLATSWTRRDRPTPESGGGANRDDDRALTRAERHDDHI